MESKNKNTILNFILFTQLSNWSSYALLGKNLIYTQKYPFEKIGCFLKRNKTQVKIQDGVKYKRATIRVNGNGISLRDELDGRDIGTKNQFLIKTDQFLLSKIDARNGAFGVVPPELNNGVITGNFWTFDVDYANVNPHYLTLLMGTKRFQELSQTASVGTTNRNYLQEAAFLNFEIPFPTLEQQGRIVNDYNEKIERAKELEREAEELEEGIEEYLFEKLGIEKDIKQLKNKGLQFFCFGEISEWGFDKIKAIGKNNKSEFKSYPVSKFAIEVFRGKSPVYKDESRSFILNQKCNRWNSLDFSNVKNVDDKWFSSIDENFFTREGDVIINSTGEGTIGRSSYIKNEYQGLLYDSHMLLLRIDSNILNPELFVELFNSQFGQNQVNDLKSAQATKQTELGVSNLNRIVIPIPESMEFQKEIIDKIKLDRVTILNLKTKASNYFELAQKEFEKEIFGV